MADVVLVDVEVLVHLGDERGVRPLARPKTLLVHQRDDALVLLLDQVADDLVVEEVDVLPLDALLAVLLLLRVQRQLDEELLQLLVAEVDAQLLETSNNVI